MARRSRAAPIAAVTWRDGVHLTGTPIWCDARRRRDVCFVSSADRVGRTGHGQLVGTAATLALLGARGDGHLTVPLRRRFTLGTLRLELIPSGRGLGAAALHVDIAGRTVLYAGAVRTAAGGVGDAAEVRACDAVVAHVPSADPRKLPPLAGAISAAIDWTRDRLDAGARPALLVDAALDGLEVAARLAAAGIPVAAARPIRDAGLRIAPVAPVGMATAFPPPGKEPRAVVWLDADRAGLARAVGDRPYATALASARAIDGARAAAADAAFAWSSHADRPQLLAWLDASGARDIYLTGPGADALAAAIGPRARVLGPPHQMPLFPRDPRDAPVP